MATPSPTSVEARPPLDRHRIVAAGIEIADRDGVDKLSMRKLAAALGYEAMSLYNHVRNKQELLDGMLDGIFGELPMVEWEGVEREGVEREGDWRAAVRQRAIDTHRMLLRHPWAAPLLPFQFPGTNRWNESEYLLGLLADAGFDDHTGDLGYHAITLHIAGFTQQQVAYAMPTDHTRAMLERFRAEATRTTYPLMNAHVDYHIEAAADPELRPDEFEFVLDLILDGLDRMRPGA